MKKNLSSILFISITAVTVVVGAIALWHTQSAAGAVKDQPVTVYTSKNTAKKDLALRDFSFTVEPKTFTINVVDGKRSIRVSEPLTAKAIADFKQTEEWVTWTYPKEGLEVRVAKKKNLVKTAPYLEVTVHATKPTSLNWPILKGDAYVLPLYEGKYIPARDRNWMTFLKGKVFTVSESLSMQFLSKVQGNQGLVYVMTNFLNNDLGFENTESPTSMAKDGVLPNILHEFPATDKNKSYGYRIYLTSSDPQAIAMAYKQDVVSRGGLVTLEEKAAQNPDIRKLYGAPEIYLWDREVIAMDNIRWSRLKNTVKTPMAVALEAYASEHAEGGKAAMAELEKVRQQGFADRYQKACITKTLNQILLSEDLYKTCKGVAPDNLTLKTISDNRLERYQQNKQLLKEAYGEALVPMNEWGNGNALSLLEDFKKSGIDRAWLGFTDWIPGMINPEFVKKAVEMGYLIAPYDSYESIHEKGGDDWITANFTDKSLYERATITKKNGKKRSGFNQVGRALNSTLAMPAVQNRVDDILKTGVGYNSWFIDCDAAGAFSDDYTPEHFTDQKQDMEACLARMAWIRDQKNMVIGSEQGNDYAATTIAFAHGLETPVINWEDEDIRLNKKSPYYAGAYWSATGGVPDVFGKSVPLKPLYEKIYLGPQYALPLFKMVYNDSVITTHHWAWGSLKIKGQERERMMGEVLYNTPPLYHLDKAAWKENKSRIMTHLKVWSPFHSQAVLSPMTDFSYLSADHLVQSASYGKMQVIANYSKQSYVIDGMTLPPKSVLIENHAVKSKQIYTP